MGTKGRTKLPCPACHRVGRKYSDPCDSLRFYDGDRPADGICADCENELERARAIVARSDRDARRKGSAMPYRVPEHGHWMPYLPHGRDMHAADRHDPGRELSGLLMELAAAVGTPSVTDGEQRWDAPSLFTRHASEAYAGSIGRREPVLLDPAIAELLDRLEVAVAEYGETAYSEGRHDGRNLLARLANGEVTVADFDDKAAAAPRPVTRAGHARRG